MKYLCDGQLREPEFFKKQEEIFRNKTVKAGRMAATLRMISKEPKKILDVGCAIGLCDKYLAEKGQQVVGVDILKDSIKIAQKFFSHPKAKFIHGNIFKVGLKKESFDLILFLETIEHVESPTAFLKRFHEFLKPGGELIVSTPNSIGITNILYNLKHSFDFVKRIEKEPVNTGTEKDHINSFDKICLYRLLYRNGFKYVDHRIIGKLNPKHYQTLIFKTKKI